MQNYGFFYLNASVIHDYIFTVYSFYMLNNKNGHMYVVYLKFIVDIIHLCYSKSNKFEIILLRAATEIYYPKNAIIMNIGCR